MLEEKVKAHRSQPPRSLDEAMRQGMEERGLPADDAADAVEAWDPAAAGHLGLLPPADPDDYVIDLPRGVARDAALETAARRWFHAAGLPQCLVTGITREYCRHICAPRDKSRALRQHAQAMAELRRDWGQDFDRKLAGAHGVIAACQGGDALEAALSKSGLADNVWLLRMLAALGEARNDLQGDGR